VSKSHYRIVRRNFRKGNVVRTWVTNIPVTEEQARFRAHQHSTRGTCVEIMPVGSNEERSLFREIGPCPAEGLFI